MKKKLTAAENAELVERAKKGDELAFSSLYKDAYPYTFNHLKRAFSGNSEAFIEDVMGEASLRAFEALPRFNGTCTFKTWFTTIARNTAMTQHGTGANEVFQHAVSIQSGGGDEEAGGISENYFVADPALSDPAHIVAGRAALKGFLDYMGKWEEGSFLRTGFEMAVANAVHGQSYEEIAQEHAIPVGTVRSTIGRFRQFVAFYRDEPGASPDLN